MNPSSFVRANIFPRDLWRVLELSLWLFVALPCLAANEPNTNRVPKEAALGAEQLLGLDFPSEKLEMALPGLAEQLEKYLELRRASLSNAVPPCLWFNPLPAHMTLDLHRKNLKLSPAPKVALPEDPEALAYYSVRDLGLLIKSRRLSSERLTRLYLERLKKYGPKLECVVTLTGERALEQARKADAEIARGHYRGPLHGIPYAAKDLLAVKGVRTTWGAAPYTNQVFDYDATVIKRLDNAGAVLVAKTTLGELAMGDVWFGGLTRNPWNFKQGSSGSSAGSAAGMAAGLFAFAIGSETYGSIVSPCDRCGITGLRPTFGRVSRAGAMTLSWSMDKLGPICRNAEDCALVLDAIRGPDGLDQSVFDVPFNYDARLRMKRLRIGCLKADFDKEKDERNRIDHAALDKLKELGANLVPVELPAAPLSAISIVLSTEAAAAFDGLTRGGKDDWLKQQEAGSWPSIFRERRFVPAVEFLQAQRLRYLLIQQTAALFANYDVIVAPSLSGPSLLLSNLTGHPCVVVPNGFTKAGTPTSICFIGKLFGEAEILAAAREYQNATDFHLRHPAL